MNAAPQIPEFLRGLRGQLRLDEPMSRHTSWRVGGAAEFFYAPADRADLAQLLRQLPPGIPLHWVGLGSNLLVRDGGVSGMVLKASKGLAEMRFPAAGKIHAEAGVTCAKVARASVERGLAGAEFLAGVPGTLGGALAMNAGAFGGETWDLVEQIECIGRDGECSVHRAAEIKSGYRHVELPARRWIIAALLALRRDGGRDGKRRIQRMLKKRNASQPLQSANAGSVFRNPRGGYAARLIEQAGLKGAQAGGAVISETHANFIINRGNAAAADIETLIDTARREVMRCSGVELAAEVRIIGRRA